MNEAKAQARSRVFVITGIILILLLIGVALYMCIVSFRQCKFGKGSSHPSSSSASPDPESGDQPYLYVYNVGAQTGITGAIAFDSQGQSTVGSFDHALNSSTIVVHTGAAGVYQFETYVQPSSVTGTLPLQFALAINGSVVAGTTFGNSTTVSTARVQGFFTAYLPPGATVTLVNVSNSGAVVNLAALPSSQINAALLMRRLACLA